MDWLVNRKKLLGIEILTTRIENASNSKLVVLSRNLVNGNQIANSDTEMKDQKEFTVPMTKLKKMGYCPQVENFSEDKTFVKKCASRDTKYTKR